VRLEVISAEPAAIQIRATDVNLIPYPGMRLVVAVNSGTVNGGDTVVTGADGIARIRWQPGSDGTRELQVAFEDGTGAVKITAP
jgi:hypothetical protein